MTNAYPLVKFFMGANTPNGFLDFSGDLYSAEDGWRAFLIKGGAGTGKSSLMRRLGERMAALGESVEYIYCSSDPHSLDGLVFRDSRQCIVDATAPHVVEPRYWDAVETIVPIDACIRADEVAAHRTAVTELIDACSAEHRRCCRFLRAAATLLEDGRRLCAEAVDRDKVRRSAERLAARELGDARRAGGREWKRFLSAITPEGGKIFYETLGALCPRIVTLEDETGTVAPLFLSVVRDRAVAAGHECFTCFCPLSPTRIEHLLVPAAGLALTASNSYHKADFPVYRRLHAARFTDAETLRGYRPRLSFHRRAVRELLSEATTASAAAKSLHDRIEEYYTPSMDWEAVAELEERVWERLRRRAAESRRA